MDCLGCNYIETAPITLRDGRIVCSNCEAWRMECEARFVLTLPNKRDYLDKVQKKRGIDAYHALRSEMVEILNPTKNLF